MLQHFTALGFIKLYKLLFCLKFEDPAEDDNDDEGGAKKRGLAEIDHARRDCKARSVLNKFKEMEQRVLNGEEEDGKLQIYAPDSSEYLCRACVRQMSGNHLHTLLFLLVFSEINCKHGITQMKSNL